ncbi:MAG: hypothetical protein ACRC1R_00920 [Cetobacterium sp.]|uniref:hypothetical protein n=1 Tax=Cetobacterium sp. TaxID=2071632 RepID=UPI002FCC4E39
MNSKKIEEDLYKWLLEADFSEKQITYYLKRLQVINLIVKFNKKKKMYLKLRKDILLEFDIKNN